MLNLFLSFSDLPYYLEETGTCFLVALCFLVVRRQLGSINHEASPSAGKSTELFSVPCCAWKCVPTTITSGVYISKIPGCCSLQQMCYQCGLPKLLPGSVSWTCCLCKQDNFESHNPIKFILEVFILLDLSLSLNQTLLISLLDVK